MGPANLISLVIMALVFIFWAGAVFRTLWQLSKRAQSRLNATGGGYFTWVSHALGSYRAFLTSDKDRPVRRRLLFLTAALFLVIAARTILLTRLY